MDYLVIQEFVSSCPNYVEVSIQPGRTLVKAFGTDFYVNDGDELMTILEKVELLSYHEVVK